MKNYLLIILLLLISCSSKEDETSGSMLDKKWITLENPRVELWFQNWSGYERLFLKISSDTTTIKPSMYVTRKSNKPYLYPKEFNRIEYTQLIGNITWNNKISWDNGYKNSFTWLIDRSNPKITLPVLYKGSVTYIDNVLILSIYNDSEMIFSYSFHPIEAY